MAKRKKATIKDVASSAGVSTTTVSMVLNGREIGISESTKERILRAVKELHYYSDYTARAMITGKTNLIGIIIPDIANAFFSELVRHLQVELARQGYDIVLCNSEEMAKNDVRYIQLLAGRNVDGLIITPSAETFIQKNACQMQKMLDSLGVPYLFLDRYYSETDPKIVMDNAESSYRVAKYLIECGHKKIGAITGPLALNSSSNRLKGLKRALGESGLHLPDEYVYEGKYDYETGLKGGEKLIQTDVSAIFAFSDIQACGVYASAQRAGKRIPDDLSVVGFDDTFYSSILETPLTTMRQPVKDIAVDTCSTILDLIDGREIAEEKCLVGELIVRDSVKKI